MSKRTKRFFGRSIVPLLRQARGRDWKRHISCAQPKGSSALNLDLTHLARDTREWLHGQIEGIARQDGQMSYQYNGRQIRVSFSH